MATAMNTFFDLLLRPFGDAATPALIVVSLLAGGLLLLLFKFTTRQKLLAERRRVLTGRLYELGLYQDDLGVLLRVQWALLRANLRYVAVTLPALLVLLPVTLLIVVQLDARWQRRALHAGESMLVSAVAEPGRTALLDRLTLEPGDGLSVTSGPVRDRGAGVVWWRVRADRDAPRSLTIRAGEAGWGHAIAPATGLSRLAATREKPGWRRMLLNPGTPPLPADAPLLSITAELPQRGGSHLGLPDWLWGFFLWSVVGGLVFKKLFKVEI